ncbi:hypothetical protein FAGKG844_20232 [Frankia sp. AgKG'84/4]
MPLNADISKQYAGIRVNGRGSHNRAFW